MKPTRRREKKHTGLLRAVRDPKGKIVAFGRTAIGQAIYDVCFSSMSAVQVAKRYKVPRQFVLDQRRKMRDEGRRKR